MALCGCYVQIYTVTATNSGLRAKIAQLVEHLNEKPGVKLTQVQVPAVTKGFFS